MHGSIAGLFNAIDEILRSKANAVLSFVVGSGTVASASASNAPSFHVVLDNGEKVFNWPFLYMTIGAIFILMQMSHFIYRFYKFVTEK